MLFIFKNAWIIFIAVTVANGLILKARSKKYVIANPMLEEGYAKLFKGIMLYGNLPWLVMALGNLSGLTNSFFDFLNPRGMNPFVISFHALIIVLWILSVRWIYFKGGAEFLANHPGLLNASSFRGNSNVTAKQIKLFFPLMLLGGVIGMIMMWSMKMPTLEFYYYPNK